MDALAVLVMLTAEQHVLQLLPLAMPLHGYARPPTNVLPTYATASAHAGGAALACYAVPLHAGHGQLLVLTSTSCATTPSAPARLRGVVEYYSCSRSFRLHPCSVLTVQCTRSVHNT